MPSWNIHTAHVERLLADAPEGLWGLRDTGDFLFGNLIPDVYVGYLVSPITKKIPYKDTHLVDASYVPSPDAAGFYARYVRGQGAPDIAVGAWTHLICDHYYNKRTREFLFAHGLEQSDEVRIQKQADFDAFGRTFSISLCPQLSEELVCACAVFEQYAIEEPDVRATIAAQQEMLVRNEREHVESTLCYQLLDDEFFATTFAEVDALLHEALALHAAGGDVSHIGRP